MKNFHSYSSNVAGKKSDNEIKGKFPEGFKYPIFTWYQISDIPVPQVFS